MMMLCTLNIAKAQDKAPGTSPEVVPQVQELPQIAKPENEYFSDPYSPISQFDPAEIDEEEEVLERFAEYGRLIHIGFNIGAVQPTGPMFNIYTMGWMMGTRVTYFLDWNFGFTFHANIGRSKMEFVNTNPATSSTVETFTGTATLFNMGFGLQFYPNFNDISKSIAWLNPSVLLGFEAFVINDRISDQNLEDLKNYDVNDPSHKVAAPGLFMGMGVDIPLIRKTVYLGLDFMYHMTFFPSYNYRIDTTDPNFGDLDYSGKIITYGMSIIWNL